MKTSINALIFPEHNSGQHFVDWSLYRLSGQTSHLVRPNGVLEEQAVISSIDSDHKHFHKHVIFSSEYNETINPEFAHTVSQFNLPLVNLHVRSDKGFANDLCKNTFNCDFYTESTHEQRTQIKSMILDRDQQRVNNLFDNRLTNLKVVFCEYSESDFLNKFYNDRFPMIDNKFMGSMEKVYSSFENSFFDKHKANFDESIWDRREKLSIQLLSLIEKPYSMSAFIDKSLPHLEYKTDDIWNDLPNVISEILEFNNCQLDTSKLAEWKNIYWAWREKHDCFFSRNFTKIIEAIINDEYMDLRRFNMDFYKDVLIQYGLLKKHNKLIKGWQVESLPSNTRDIHLLLEDNFHNLESI